MPSNKKKIAEMNREELRDHLLVIQERMNNYVRAVRRNFASMVSVDKQKEEIEKRLQELEDWEKKVPEGRGQIFVRTPSAE